MKLVIDRIENEIAVCQNIETKEMIEVLVKELPLDSKEGMCLNFENGIYTLDVELEEELKNRINKKIELLWEDYDD